MNPFKKYLAYKADDYRVNAANIRKWLEKQGSAPRKVSA